MIDNERRLRDILKRLLESLDYAHITFDEAPGHDPTEAALEFDEIYLEACEALGFDLPKPEPAAVPIGAGAPAGV